MAVKARSPVVMWMQAICLLSSLLVGGVPAGKPAAAQTCRPTGDGVVRTAVLPLVAGTSAQPSGTDLPTCLPNGNAGVRPGSTQSGLPVVDGGRQRLVVHRRPGAGAVGIGADLGMGFPQRCQDGDRGHSAPGDHRPVRAWRKQRRGDAHRPDGARVRQSCLLPGDYHVSAHRSSNGDAHMDGNQHTDGVTNVDAYADTDLYGYSDGNGDTDSHAYGNGNAHAESDAQSNGDGNTVCNADLDCHGYGDAIANRDADIYGDSGDGHALHQRQRSRHQPFPGCLWPVQGWPSWAPSSCGRSSPRATTG